MPSWFPTPWTVGVHTWSEGVDDGYGGHESGYTPALDQPGNDQAVHGWGPPTSTEPKLAGHDRVVVEVELLAPPEFTCGPHDIITLPGPEPLAERQYDVIGYPEDSTHGPFLPGFGGLVINLKRSTG